MKTMPVMLSILVMTFYSEWAVSFCLSAPSSTTSMKRLTPPNRHKSDTARSTTILLSSG
eukprot:CAMPEP_0171319358 /NCGR_PEP_ID=MMETSP0816-20121228/95930_1 /TAXON_ID=420281 /ORGANISM="Proboscia inermis, Strain CCAP1064/1" /LENGTH=58 /DNA_ID=CAMNT_0011814953 /DNA_START=13 /DNA_END=185 /DNA_ORIENTATION=-